MNRFLEPHTRDLSLILTLVGDRRDVSLRDYILTSEHYWLSVALGTNSTESLVLFRDSLRYSLANNLRQLS